MTILFVVIGGSVVSVVFLWRLSGVLRGVFGWVEVLILRSDMGSRGLASPREFARVRLYCLCVFFLEVTDGALLVGVVIGVVMCSRE